MEIHHTLQCTESKWLKDTKCYYRDGNTDNSDVYCFFLFFAHTADKSTIKWEQSKRKICFSFALSNESTSIHPRFCHSSQKYAEYPR